VGAAGVGGGEAGGGREGNGLGMEEDTMPWISSGLGDGQLEGVREACVKGPLAMPHVLPSCPGLPALMVIGTGSANSYGLYTIRDQENRTSLEL
jgi:hypothetical protein